ncbi:MAG: hypothetical protein JSS27_06580 [Planctomycetes bacterium]|nr:hypothetical protein [Planctomycetota bacterium]
MIRPVLQLLLLGLLVPLASARPSWAVEPSRPIPRLSSLVPAEAGLVIEFHQVSPAVRSMLGSEALARWQQSPFWRRVAEGVMKEGRNINDKLQKQIGAGLPQLADLLLGDETTLAIWPPDRLEDKGTMLLLVQSQDQRRLAEFVERLVKGKESVFKTSQMRLIGGEATIYEVAPPHIEDRTWITVLTPAQGIAQGSLLIVATHRPAFDMALAHWNPAAGKPLTLESVPEYHEAVGRLDPKAQVRVLLNPRRWDKLLREQAAPSGEPRATVRRGLINIWSASRYLAGTLRFDDAVECQVVWDCPRAKLPPGLQRVASALAGDVTTIGHVPSDACLVAAGQFDLGSVLKAWLGEHSAEQPGWFKPEGDVGAWAGLMTVLKGVGPNVAVAAAPVSSDAEQATAGAATTSPIDWVVSLETQSPDAGSDQPALAEMFGPMVHAWLQTAQQADRAAREMPNLKVASQQSGAMKITSLAGFDRHRPERQLCLATAGNWLSLATSVTVLERSQQSGAVAEALKLAAPNSAASNSEVATSQLIYVDVERFRKLYPRDEASADGIRQRAPWANEFDRAAQDILPWLEGLDTISVRARFDETGAGLSVRLE